VVRAAQRWPAAVRTATRHENMMRQAPGDTHAFSLQAKAHKKEITPVTSSRHW